MKPQCYSYVRDLVNVPGANCSIFGCNTNKRHTGVGLFSLPRGDDELSKKNRSEWVRVITCSRQVDQDLPWQINMETLNVCLKHFEEKCVEKRKYLQFLEYIIFSV